MLFAAFFLFPFKFSKNKNVKIVHILGPDMNKKGLFVHICPADNHFGDINKMVGKIYYNLGKVIGFNLFQFLNFRRLG